MNLTVATCNGVRVGKVGPVLDFLVLKTVLSLNDRVKC